MIPWSETHPYLRGALLTLMFVTMCFALCLLPPVLSRKGCIKKLALCLCGVVSFAGIVLFGSGMKASYYSVNQGALTLRCEQLRVWLIVAGLVVVNSYLAMVLRQELRYRKNAITPDSVKESLDHLPTGLCFCDGNGTVMLSQSSDVRPVSENCGQRFAGWDVVLGDPQQRDATGECHAADRGGTSLFPTAGWQCLGLQTIH